MSKSKFQIKQNKFQERPAVAALLGSPQWGSPTKSLEILKLILNLFQNKFRMTGYKQAKALEIWN